MAMKTMQIRLTRKQIELLERMVKRGQFPNKGEAIREAVNRMLSRINEQSYR